MVGALQYLTMTLSNIVYAVNMASQFMHAHRTTQLYAVKRISRYLQYTLTFSMFLHSSNYPTVAITYSNADWEGSPNTRCSTTGYVVFLGKNLIS